jgi:multicomponent Na+:H+ antiporter subunit D
MYTVFGSDYIIDYLPATTILGWLAAVAIIAGSMMALAQYDLKRMLAYSSISQIGYVILGIAIANPLGMTGGLLHILNHALMKGCLFLVAGAIIYATGLRHIQDFRGLGKRMPLTMAAFTVAALSMIGVPPTIGFLSKWYIALGAINAGNWFFLAVILLSSLLNLAYFWRVIDILYFGKSKTNIDIVKVPVSMNIPILTLAFGCVFFGVFGALPVSIITPMITVLR